LSRESTLFPGADVVPVTEGSTDGRDTPKVRYERPFDLHDGWKFAPRVEFTAVSTNDGSNPPGTFATGLGDTQFQGVFRRA
jgi:hypothetical protein